MQRTCGTCSTIIELIHVLNIPKFKLLQLCANAMDKDFSVCKSKMKFKIVLFYFSLSRKFLIHPLNYPQQ